MSYYLMRRGWMDHDAFRGEPYSSAIAWCWLIENAAWEPTAVMIERSRVVLNRGELAFSEPFLAKKWKWARSRVHRFLDDLVSNHMISRRNSRFPGVNRVADSVLNRVANRGKSIITICNYSKYQALPSGSEQLSEQLSEESFEHKNKERSKKERKRLPNGSHESPDGDSRQKPPENRRLVAERMVEIWKEEIRDSLPVPSKLTEGRIVHASARFADEFGKDLEQWRAFCRELRSKPFLVGDNDRQWRASFDWAVKPASILGVREGKYDRAKPNGNGASPSYGVSEYRKPTGPPPTLGDLGLDESKYSH